MQSLNDERKEVLGEVLTDELKIVREYVEDVPKVKDKVHQVYSKVDEINTRLTVMEGVVIGHESDIRKLKYIAA